MSPAVAPEYIFTPSDRNPPPFSKHLMVTNGRPGGPSCSAEYATPRWRLDMSPSRSSGQLLAISQPPKERPQLVRYRIALGLDAHQHDTVLLPPALEGGNDLLPVVGDVARHDGVELTAQNAEHQLAGSGFVELADSDIELLHEIGLVSMGSGCPSPGPRGTPGQCQTRKSLSMSSRTTCARLVWKAAPVGLPLSGAHRPLTISTSLSKNFSRRP